METYICISLKRLAVQNMQAVKEGRLTYSEGERIVSKLCDREQLIEELTRRFDSDSVDALRFFRVL